MNVIAKIDSQALDLWAGYLAGIVQNGSDSEDEIFLGVLSILGWAFFSLVAVYIGREMQKKGSSGILGESWTALQTVFYCCAWALVASIAFPQSAHDPSHRVMLTNMIAASLLGIVGMALEEVKRR